MKAQPSAGHEIERMVYYGLFHCKGNVCTWYCAWCKPCFDLHIDFEGGNVMNKEDIDILEVGNAYTALFCKKNTATPYVVAWHKE